MLVDLEGIPQYVGGGPIEATAIREAVEAIKKCLPNKEVQADNKEAGGVGMICGGRSLSSLMQLSSGIAFNYRRRAYCPAPCSHGENCWFHVTVMDDREEFCNSERFPTADKCLVGEIPELLQEWKITGNTYITIITRGHEYDEIALEKTLLSGAFYLGMIGSQTKVKRIYSNLIEKGFSEKDLEKVHAPIGLDIKAITAEEIAVSILAQLIFVKQGKRF